MENKNKSEEEQVKAFLLLMLKNWRYFVVSMIVCLGIALVYIKVATPVVKVSSKVNIRYDDGLTDNVAPSSGSLRSIFGMGSGGNLNIEDEIIKISSQGYVKNVIKKMDLNKEYTEVQFLGLKKVKLYEKSPIKLSPEVSLANDTIGKVTKFKLKIKEDKITVKVKYGRDSMGKYEISSLPATIETPVGSYTFSATDFYDNIEFPYSLSIEFANYDFITQNYRKLLFFDFEKKTSDIIHLEMNNENALFAKNILTEIINTYNEIYELEKEVINIKSKNYINQRLDIVTNDLKLADKAVQDFKDKHNLTDISTDASYYMSSKAGLESRILNTETQLNVMDIILDFVKNDDNKYSLIPFDLQISASNESVGAMISLYNENLMKRNDLFQSNSQSALAKSLDSHLSLQRENLLKSLTNIQEGTQIALKNLKQKEKEAISRLGIVPDLEMEFAQLKRNQELQQGVYVVLLEMREQQGLKSMRLLPKLNIIDEPYQHNKAVSPSKIKVAILVLVFGGFIFPVSAICGLPLIRRVYLRYKKNK